MRNALKSAICTIALLGLAACGNETTAPEPSTPTEQATLEQTTQTDPSTAILAMAQDHAERLLQKSPAMATELGVSEEVAGAGYLSRFGGYGFNNDIEARALNEAFLQELRSYDRDALSGTALVTYDVLKDAYELAARRNQFEFGGATPMAAASQDSGSSWATTPYMVTQLTGPHLYLPRMLQTEHPLETKEHAQAYLARLSEFARAFDEVIETVGSDAAAGIVPPRFIVDGVIGNINGLTKNAAGANPLVTVFATKIDRIDALSDAEKTAFVEDATKRVEEIVYPAYGRLKAQFEALADGANNDAGIWRLGDQGAAFYQMALNGYGAQGKTGDDVHELGLSEVARIHGEMDGLLKSIGLEEGSVGARMQQLSARDDNTYPNTDEGREELLQSLRDQIAEIMARAPQWFSSLPPQAVEVRRIPAHEQDSAPGGYYSGPSLDGARPGAYWINLKNTADNPKHGLKTLTYHEAVPGHHFSISSQRAIKDMPLIRNILSYSEFEEGWALYGEKLAKEMGMYEDDPEGDLGRLQAELFRAARLVVDTGLHVKRWTREEAIDYMVEATGESRASVTREVERYSAVPGQACAYKLGMLAIEAMRADAEAELGDAFDIKAFHHEVLSGGSMPMQVLDARIKAWVERSKA